MNPPPLRGHARTFGFIAGFVHLAAALDLVDPSDPLTAAALRGATLLGRQADQLEPGDLLELDLSHLNDQELEEVGLACELASLDFRLSVTVIRSRSRHVPARWAASCRHHLHLRASAQTLSRVS